MKIRYARRETEAVLRSGETNAVNVHLNTPLRDVTLGQVAVFHRGDVIRGGDPIVGRI